MPHNEAFDSSKSFVCNITIEKMPQIGGIPSLWGGRSCRLPCAEGASF